MLNFPHFLNRLNVIVEMITHLIQNNIEESSMTTTSISPRKEEKYKGDIIVVDSLLANVFTKLTDFCDFLGRKQIFAVDWDYLSRKWNYSHTYLKDNLLESLLALGLNSDVINSQSKDIFVCSKINKMFASLYSRVNFFDETCNNEENIFCNIYENSISEGDDQSDIHINYQNNSFKFTHWVTENERVAFINSRQTHSDCCNRKIDILLKMIENKTRYECELITIKGSYHGFLYSFLSYKDKNLRESKDSNLAENNCFSSFLYFKSCIEENSKFFKFSTHLFKSLEPNQRKECIDFIINFEDINELREVNFLCRPIGIEIFDQTNNISYFFNMFETEK